MNTMACNSAVTSINLKAFNQNQVQQDTQKVSPRREKKSFAHDSVHRQKLYVPYVNTHQSQNTNPWAALKNNIICDSTQKSHSTHHDDSIDEPVEVKVKPNIPVDSRQTNVIIGVGLVSRRNPYIVIRVRSFSDEKLPKKGREQVVTLSNGDKCTFMGVEIKCKLPTGSKFVTNISGMFHGSQRPVPKEPVITNVIPTSSQIRSIDDSDDFYASIRGFPPAIKYVYIELIKEIRRLYHTDVKLEEANFDVTETPRSPVRISPIQTPVQSPTHSPAHSPVNSPTKSPVAVPSFLEVAKKPAQPDSSVTPRDTAKPASPSTPREEEPKLHNKFVYLADIDARTGKIDIFGVVGKDCCIRK
jgi:hypothetical protein